MSTTYSLLIGIIISVIIIIRIRHHHRMPIQRPVLPTPNHLLNAVEGAYLHPVDLVPTSVLIPELSNTSPHFLTLTASTFPMAANCSSAAS